MFKGAYQRKLLTVLYSGGSNPLELWGISVKNGWTRRVKDDDLGAIVFEIAGTNVATAFIESPPDPRAGLAISLPFINMFIKNLKRYFTFEIQILDDKQMRRRFRFSNYQRATKVRPFACSVPLALKPGWNQMQINLANFTMRAYGTKYLETQRVQIHANCRIRRVYFSDRVYTDEELPRDYRVYLDVRQQQQQAKKASPKTSISGEPLPVEKRASSILKVGPTSMPSETLVTETSYKSTTTVGRKPSIQIGDRTSITRSVHSMLTESSRKLTPEKMKDVERVVSFVEVIKEEGIDGELEGIVKERGQSEHAPEDAEVLEGIEEAEELEGVEIPVAPDAGETTEEDLSPRTGELTESEYAESVPPVLESDVEEALEPLAVEEVEEATPPEQAATGTGDNIPED